MVQTELCSHHRGIRVTGDRKSRTLYNFHIEVTLAMDPNYHFICSRSIIITAVYDIFVEV